MRLPLLIASMLLVGAAPPRYQSDREKAKERAETNWSSWHWERPCMGAAWEDEDGTKYVGVRERWATDFDQPDSWSTCNAFGRGLTWEAAFRDAEKGGYPNRRMPCKRR